MAIWCMDEYILYPLYYTPHKSQYFLSKNEKYKKHTLCKQWLFSAFSQSNVNLPYIKNIVIWRIDANLIYLR